MATIPKALLGGLDVSASGIYGTFAALHRRHAGTAARQRRKSPTQSFLPPAQTEKYQVLVSPSSLNSISGQVLTTPPPCVRWP